jgi:hypothetical protein
MILKSVTALLPQDLGVSDSPTFAGLTLSGLNPKSIVFINAADALAEDITNLVWDYLTIRLGVGTNSPTERLEVKGGDLLVDNTANNSAGLYIYGARADVASAFASLYFDNIDSDDSNVRYTGAKIDSYNDNEVGGGSDHGNLIFYTKNIILTERMRITYDGKVLLPDNAAIGLGNISDVLIDYDSGNNSLDIDLTTNGIDTGLRIQTDGDHFTIDGGTGHWCLGGLPSARYKSIIAGSSITINGYSGALTVETGFQPTGTATSFHSSISGFAYFRDAGISWGSAFIEGLHFGIGNIVAVTNAGSATLVGINVSGWFALGYNATVDTVIVTGDNYGLYIEEISEATSANDYELFIAGGGEIFFRDNAIHVGSLDDGHLDLTSDISIDMNADMDVSTKNIITDIATGTRIATAANQKLSFYDIATPIVQPSSVGETTGYSAVGGTNVDHQDTFTGNLGTKAYTINDIVKHLKSLGLVASS